MKLNPVYMKPIITSITLSLILFSCANAPLEDELGNQRLVETVVERSGENCTEGGVLVKTGYDNNSNGTLEDDEITFEEYICDGETNIRDIIGGFLPGKATQK